MWILFLGVRCEGDANDDGQVNGRDILPIGIFWGDSGPPRPDSGSDWRLHGVATWSKPGAAAADGNGNGIVDAEDIAPVAANWRQTRSGAKVAGDGPVPVALVDPLGVDLLLQMVEVLEGMPSSDGVLEVRALLEQAIRVKTLPTEFSLSQNYPNPFNPTTVIEFTVPAGERGVEVALRIFDVAGQVVRSLADDVREPGRYTAEWDGTDSQGRSVASGVYLYQLRAGEFSAVRRMLLVR